MSTRQPSLLRKAISVLASFALAIAFVPIAWAEGETHTVDFGNGSWAVGDVAVNADKTGTISALGVNDEIKLTGFNADTMQAKVVATDGFTAILVVTDGKTSLAARNSEGGLPDSALTFSVVAKNNESGGGEGNTPGTSDPSNPGNLAPEHNGKQGYLSFDNSDISGGSLWYAFGNGKASDVTDWSPVQTTNYAEGQNWYYPINLSEANGATNLFLKIQSVAGKQLDTDKGVYFADENRQNKLIINGTFNDDPDFNKNHDGAVQLPNTGLFDLYNSKTDTYYIPLDLNADYMTGVRSMEFGWIDARTINVAVDPASQYLLTNEKVEIGIATGKGFQTTVENGSYVSIPVLPNADGEGREEHYLIDLKVNPKYFIPYLVFNGTQFGTWDNHSGTPEYTSVAAAIPAKDFPGLFQNGSNTLTINLTVDKTLDVTQDGGSQIEASFNMIEDGVAAGGADMALLDGAALTAEEASNDRDGQLPAYDITLASGESPISEFAADISISVPGAYEDGVEYVVYREHKGQETQMLKATVENNVLSFETNLFSKFTIAVAPGSGGGSDPGTGGSTGGGGSTPAPSEPQTPPITNAGSGDSASTTVDVTDKVTTTETGSTQVAVDADLGTKIIENAIENKVADVVIKADTSAGNSTATSVALPASTVRELAEKTEASVTISTDSAQVTLDKAAVAAVAEQAGEEGSVQLVVQTSEQNKNKVQIEVTLQTSNGNVSDFRGGSVTISVPVSEELAAKNLVCVYIDANGKYTKMPGTLSADGKSYVFATGHFSTYAVMAESDADAAIAEQAAAEAAAIAKAKPGTPSVKLSSPAKGKLTVKASAKKAKGYRVYYKKAGWKAYKTYTTSGTVKTLSKTLKKLSKGTYTVKVRAFGKTAAGKVVWGGKSKAKKVAVK